MIRLTLTLLVGLVVNTITTAAESASPQTQLINERIAAKWAEMGVKRPAPPASDHEFLRRVFIDLIGRIATLEEVIDFEQDRDPNKRAKLINRLLYSNEYKPRVNGRPVKKGDGVLTFDYADEYARHWSTIWTVWLMSRTTHPVYREQMNFWLYVDVFLPNASYKEMVTQLLTATGKSNVNGSVNFVAHQLGEMVPENRRNQLGEFDAVPVTSRVTRLFLGLQTQCVQCHDHPFNPEWVQADFWGVNAYFRQVNRDGIPTPADMPRNQQTVGVAVLDVTDVPTVNDRGIIFYERRDGKLMATKPNFLKDIEQANNDERAYKTMPETPGLSRRDAVADYVFQHDNHAKAYVNRIWGHLFGRGLNQEDSFDDFGSHNPVLHQELLTQLSDSFVEYNYDPKMLLEWICNSDVYQLSHVAPKAYTDPKFEPYFVHMPLKALSPEVLFNSLATATQANDAPSSDTRKKAREDWINKLVQNFGDDEGNEMTFNGTIVQALLMMNGKELNNEISSQGATAVKRVIDENSIRGIPNPNRVFDDLFVMTLNRHATPTEIAKLRKIQTRGAILESKDDKTQKSPSYPNRPGWKGGQVVAPSATTDITFYEDVYWALLNTNEFMLNH